MALKLPRFRQKIKKNRIDIIELRLYDDIKRSPGLSSLEGSKVVIVGM